MDSQWLKKKFEQNPGKTKADLARALGLEAPAISKILNGTRQIKATEYVVMREFFNDHDAPKIKPGKPGNYIIEPLVNDGNLKESSHGDGDWVMPAKLMSQHTDAPSDQIKIFEVRESFMEPDFRKGEHVMVDLREKKPSPPGIFVVSDGFGTLVRHCEFMASSNPPKIKISAISNKFQPQILTEEEFKIIGRVIAKLQWL